MGGFPLASLLLHMRHAVVNRSVWVKLMIEFRPHFCGKKKGAGWVARYSSGLVAAKGLPFKARQGQGGEWGISRGMGRQSCWLPPREGSGSEIENRNQVVAGSACSGRRAPAPRTSSSWIAACVLFACMPIEAGQASSISLGFSPPFASSTRGFVLSVRNHWSAIEVPREDAAGAGGRKFGSKAQILGRRLRAGGRIGSMPLNSVERNTVVEEAAPPPPSSAEKKFGSSLAERRKKSAPIARGIGLRLVLLVRFLLGSHSPFSFPRAFLLRPGEMSCAGSCARLHLPLFCQSSPHPCHARMPSNPAALLAPFPLLCTLQQSNPTTLLAPFPLFLQGKPCSGKGTQAPMICRKYRMVHISVGDLLRAGMYASSPAPPLNLVIPFATPPAPPPFSCHSFNLSSSSGKGPRHEYFPLKLGPSGLLLFGLRGALGFGFESLLGFRGLEIKAKGSPERAAWGMQRSESGATSGSRRAG
jgi:hypothetical protein